MHSCTNCTAACTEALHKLHCCMHSRSAATAGLHFFQKTPACLRCCMHSKKSSAGPLHLHIYRIALHFCTAASLALLPSPSLGSCMSLSISASLVVDLHLHWHAAKILQGLVVLQACPLCSPHRWPAACKQPHISSLQSCKVVSSITKVHGLLHPARNLS